MTSSDAQAGRGTSIRRLLSRIADAYWERKVGPDHPIPVGRERRLRRPGELPAPSPCWGAFDGRHPTRRPR